MYIFTNISIIRIQIIIQRRSGKMILLKVLCAIVLIVFVIYWFELDTLALVKLEPWFRRHSRKLE